MGIELSGLAGFDSASLVSQLVQVASKPVAALDSKKSLVDSAGVTMNSFSSKLAALKTAAAALSSTSGFSSMSTTSSDSAIVASASGGGAASSYAVTVTQLARAQKERSVAFQSATTALGQAGDLMFTIDGKTTKVSVVATDSLADVASKISRSGVRLAAAVINVGGAYHLSLQGLDTGAANALTVSTTGSVSLGFSTVETAADAQLTIDGLAVTRPTNRIADAIPGMTLALTKTTAEPATVALNPDSSALKSKLQAFMTAYNDVVSSGHSATGYGSAKASNAVLAADSAIRRSLDQISRIVSGAVPGAAGTYRSLAAVGVSLGRDGLMAFDGAKLDQALEKDPESVRRLFVTDGATSATGVMKSLADLVTGLVTTERGPIKARIDALSSQSRRLADERVKKQERVDAYAKALKKQFADLDQAMSRYQSMSAKLGSLQSG